MKKIKVFLISLFVVCMFLPALFFNFKSNYISEIDNRKLTEFPSLENINSSTLKTFNSYINDRIGGREQAIDAYTYLMDNMFHILVHPNYIYGKDDYIFFYIDNEIKYSEYHENFVNEIVKIRDYVESQGSEFYMVVNPEKKSVYTEYLPEGINYNRNWAETFGSKLLSQGVNYIDNTELLKDKASSEFVYDKKYDAGH